MITLVSPSDLNTHSKLFQASEMLTSTPNRSGEPASLNQTRITSLVTNLSTVTSIGNMGKGQLVDQKNNPCPNFKSIMAYWQNKTKFTFCPNCSYEFVNQLCPCKIRHIALEMERAI